jgi:hypothetical protein
MYSVIATVAIIVTYCFAKQTKFLESTIALVSFVEMIAWISVVYMFMDNHRSASFGLALIAIMLHLVFNLAYLLVYLKCMMKRADPTFMVYYRYNKVCSNASLIISSILTFKFHLITFSACGNGDHLKA